MDSDQGLGNSGVPIFDNTLNSEQTLLWRTWREKSRSADRLAEKRMTVLLLVVGVILLACVLYYAFRARASFDPNQQHPAAMNEYSSTPISWFHRQHSVDLASNRARQQSHDNAGCSRG